MALPREIEVQRIENLVRGFQWVKVREEMEGTKVRVTFEKDLGQGVAGAGAAVPS